MRNAQLVEALAAVLPGKRDALSRNFLWKLRLQTGFNYVEMFRKCATASSAACARRGTAAVLCAVSMSLDRSATPADQVQQRLRQQFCSKNARAFVVYFCLQLGVARSPSHHCRTGARASICASQPLCKLVLQPAVAQAACGACTAAKCTTILRVAVLRSGLTLCELLSGTAIEHVRPPTPSLRLARLQSRTSHRCAQLPVLICTPRGTCAGLQLRAPPTCATRAASAPPVQLTARAPPPQPRLSRACHTPSRAGEPHTHTAWRAGSCGTC